jgi:hypothetical protein
MRDKRACEDRRGRWNLRPWCWSLKGPRMILCWIGYNFCREVSRFYLLFNMEITLRKRTRELFFIELLQLLPDRRLSNSHHDVRDRVLPTQPYGVLSGSEAVTGVGRWGRGATPILQQGIEYCLRERVRVKVSTTTPGTTSLNVNPLLWRRPSRLMWSSLDVDHLT